MYKVAYATGSRADYGIVRNYLKCLNEDEEVCFEVLVTGSLLEKQYGESYRIIENDGFKIAEKVYIELDSKTNSKVIRSMSIALDTFGSFFEHNKYDLLIILGDRYEMLSVAIAAAMQRIPILHLHGGEITLGNYDEFIRHSISKMSTYHFTSTEEYRKRVIQLGERPENVFNIGALGAENSCVIIEENVLPELKVFKGEKYFVVLFHPETLTNCEPIEQIKQLLDAIEKYVVKYKFIFLGSNADTGSEQIRNRVFEYCKEKENAFYFENLHPDGYHYLVKEAIALIGNSSSGIIEAPTLGTCTVNIGDRQKGRVRGNSIFDVDCSSESIVKAIGDSLEFSKGNIINPYYKKNACQSAYSLTKEILSRKQNIKEFFDLPKSDKR